MIDFNNKSFRVVASAGGGDVTEETTYEFQQEGALVSATYSGGLVLFGHLIAMINDEGVLDIRYHHVNFMGRMVTGISSSLPELDASGKILLHDTWKMTSGSLSEGTTVLEESQDL